MVQQEVIVSETVLHGVAALVPSQVHIAGETTPFAATREDYI